LSNGKGFLLVCVKVKALKNLAAIRVQGIIFDQICNGRGLFIIWVDLDKRIRPIPFIGIFGINCFFYVFSPNCSKTTGKKRKIIQNIFMKVKDIRH
jgi:hypothetical protein